MRRQKTVWVVDDIEEIIYSFMAALANQTDYCFVYVANAKDVKAEPGDIVFLDLTGTNAPALQVKDGVKVIRMTGGERPADLYKPFSGKEINVLVQKLNDPKDDKKAA